jgi:hypothetical protein
MKHETQEPIGRSADCAGVSRVARHVRDHKCRGRYPVPPLNLAQAANETFVEKLANWRVLVLKLSGERPHAQFLSKSK